MLLTDKSEKFLPVSICLFLWLVLFSPQPGSASAQESALSTSDLALAERYAPVFYLHPNEVYFPQPVDVVLAISRMRHNVRMWFDTTLLDPITMQGLFSTPGDATCFLDQWFGDTGSSEYTNYLVKKAIYEASLSPRAGGLEPVIYAHVLHDEVSGYTTIQYWVFYFYNDWFNKHEGDWEMVEVILKGSEAPEWVVYSQHHGGVRRTWASAPKENATHPVVYVARGSHANYTAANEVYPNTKDIGNRQLVLVDRTGIGERVTPKVILIPTRQQLAAEPTRWSGAEWLMFRGRWGETGFGDFNGPYGPADKGTQWEEPLVWGIGQPLDTATWFNNRLRVEMVSPTPVHITLLDPEGELIPNQESVDNLTVLHAEPADTVFVRIAGTPEARGEVNIYWPDRAGETVTRQNLSDLVLDASGLAQFELSANQVVFLAYPNRLTLQPTLLETYPAVWDAPDSVLVGMYLPLNRIMGGLSVSLLISLLPTLVLVAILYSVDRYHKEPIRMLVVAFIWGAIPALVIALSLQVFLKLPPGALGPNALEAIRLGLLAPVVEETLKALGVLFVYWRRPKEINDVLDGMIYGAVVGFGFAFISNLSRYVGNFIAWGYEGLSTSIIAERTVNALDHGLYTAIFGAGLGFAILTKSRRQFWSRIIVALVVAVGTHALHNLLANSLVGLNVFTVIVTSAGTLVLWAVAAWSLVKQRQLLRSELQGLVDDALYHSVYSPSRRFRAQWTTLRRNGFRAWIKLRRLQGMCIKLAQARLQVRLSPENPASSDEASALQAEIGRLFSVLK